jgi:hypothetical protein
MENKRIYLFVLILAAAFLLLACQNENPVTTSETDLALKTLGTEGDIPPGELTEAERDGLIHMRLEEKVARDVYIVMGNLYNHQVFLTIQLSEQKHMDAMKKLLTKYNVEDPVTTDEVGVFSDPDFQALYDQFILQGQVSLHEALLVGKAIEELDITDLSYQLSFVDNPDIINVYNNLLAASQSHLFAFNKCLIVTGTVGTGI